MGVFLRCLLVAGRQTMPSCGGQRRRQGYRLRFVRCWRSSATRCGPLTHRPPERSRLTVTVPRFGWVLGRYEKLCTGRPTPPSLRRQPDPTLPHTLVSDCSHVAYTGHFRRQTQRQAVAAHARWANAACAAMACFCCHMVVIGCSRFPCFYADAASGVCSWVMGWQLWSRLTNGRC